MAISDAMDVTLQHSNHNIDTFTDSLSAVEAMSNYNNNVEIDLHLLEIRDKYTKFSNVYKNNSSVTIYWIAAHVGILGNELADTHAKNATEQQPTIKQIPYSDFKSLKNIGDNETIMNKEIKGLTKGQISFKTYYKKSNKP